MNQKEFMELQKLREENEQLKKQLAEKPAKRTSENTLVKDARLETGLYRLNAPENLIAKVTGFDPSTKRNEALTKRLEILSGRNGFYDVESSEGRKKFFMAKAIDKSGLYVHPEYGIVYCSININQAAKRTIYALDRAGKAAVKEYFANISKDQWVAK